MKSQNVINALIATLLCSAAISAPAFAGDNKVYPGSACATGTTPTNGSFSLIVNRFLNTGNTDLFVLCPVVRDETSTAEGGGPDAFIDVSSTNVSCSVLTTNLQGTTVAQRSAIPFQLSPGVFRYDIRDVPQVSQGAYGISCRVPPSTAILRYSVAE